MGMINECDCIFQESDKEAKFCKEYQLHLNWGNAHLLKSLEKKKDRTKIKTGTTDPEYWVFNLNYLEFVSILDNSSQSGWDKFVQKSKLKTPFLS